MAAPANIIRISTQALCGWLQVKVLCTLRCLPRGPCTGSTGWPALICASTRRWPGMIQKNTLALMAVAIIAPTSTKAARPANQRQASQEASPTSRHTSAAAAAAAGFFLAHKTGERAEEKHKKKGQRQPDGGGRLPVDARLVDQVSAGAVQVRQRKQRKAADPGAVALPEEPVQ